MGITDIVQVSRTWRDVPVFFDAKRRSWHSTDLARRQRFGRYWGKNRHAADAVQITLVTRSGPLTRNFPVTHNNSPQRQTRRSGFDRQKPRLN
jgi:hypothetical protein